MIITIKLMMIIIKEHIMIWFLHIGDVDLQLFCMWCPWNRIWFYMETYVNNISQGGACSYNPVNHVPRGLNILASNDVAL